MALWVSVHGVVYTLSLMSHVSVKILTASVVYKDK